MTIKEKVEYDLFESIILYRCRSDKEFGIKICDGCDTPIEGKEWSDGIATKVKSKFSKKQYLLCKKCLDEARD